MDSNGHSGASSVPGSAIRLRTLQAASLVLALAGLFLLYLYSIHRDIPLVRVESITPGMNFATVRLAGTVVRSPYRFESGGMIFHLDDGSGVIAVTLGREAADALRTSGRSPQKGDRIEVAGSLSVADGREVRLRMRHADGMVFLSPRAPAATITETVRELSIAQVGPEHEGQDVVLAGTLKTIRVPLPGSRSPYVLLLEEDEGRIRIVFWPDIFPAPDFHLPVPGTRLRVRGRVEIHREQLQVRVLHGGHLEEEHP